MAEPMPDIDFANLPARRICRVESPARVGA
jgi:hypothetical protein